MAQRREETAMREAAMRVSTLEFLGAFAPLRETLLRPRNSMVF